SRNARGEFLAVGQGKGRHEAAVAMAAHADSASVHKRMGPHQPVHGFLDVLELLDPELVEHSPGRNSSLTTGAARVRAKDNDASWGQQLVLREGGRRGVANGGCVRPAVGKKPYRVATGSIEVGGISQASFQDKAIG